MGYLAVSDVIRVAGPDAALEWHLQLNLFPRLDPGAVEVTRQVYARIKKGTYAPDETLTWKWANGESGLVRAEDVVRGAHLEAFVDYFDRVHAEWQNVLKS